MATARSAIQLLVLDVDGVLTDGRLYYGTRGEALKAFHVRDGYGIQQVLKAGIKVAVISGRRSPAVARRCKELGIKHVIQGAADKLKAFQILCKRLRINATQCACIGDDTPDVAMMRTVGLSFATADAHSDAKAAAQHLTTLKGGKGAVREVCDLLTNRE